jgi:hypothetical protein
MNTNTKIILPTITNLEEAAAVNSFFPAVITAGPSPKEVRWAHANHFVRTFEDYIDGPYAPTVNDVEALLGFAAKNSDSKILIHCHAGMSRSTATAWGVSILRGMDPIAAYDTLKNQHPEGRMFYPNDAMVKHLESIFDIADLQEYNVSNHYSGDFYG